MRSEMRLIESALEYRDKEELNEIPLGMRGIYCLYKKRASNYNLVYVGMSNRSIRGRLRQHREHKGGLWSHFSYFQVFDNIPNYEVTELEGLFRHLYQFNSKANTLNKQLAHRPLGRVRRTTETLLGMTKFRRKK